MCTITLVDATPTILKEALYAKFKQNRQLLNFLLATGDSKLGEACEDEFWGTGFKIGDHQAYNTDIWKSNLMGNTMMEIRGDIQ